MARRNAIAMMAKRKRGNDEPLFSWHVGDLVNAIWPPSGRWYTANITELHAGEVTVQFRADNMNRRLKMHQIKHLIVKPEMQLVQLQKVKIVAEPMHSNPSVLIHHTIKEEPEVLRSVQVLQGVATHDSGETKSFDEESSDQVDDSDLDETYPGKDDSSESSDGSSVESGDSEEDIDDTHRVANTDTSRSLKEVPKEPDAKLRDAKISKCLGLKEKLVNVKVPFGSNNKKWSKPDYCYYCEKKFTSKISRHIRNMHATEKWVEELLVRSKGEEEKSYYNRRDIELKRIQNAGNYKHNIKVIENGNGELAVARRPERSVPAHKYLPCLHCYGFYARKTLTRHIRECKLRPSASKIGCKTDGLLLLAPFINNAEQVNMDLLLSNMKETKKNAGVVEVIRNDPLIRTFGRHQLERLGDADVRYSDLNNIRSKLRSIAKLYICLKEVLPNKKGMSSMIDPSCYESFVQTVRKSMSKSKQLAFTLGIYIKQLTLLKIAEAIKESNRREKENAEEFLQVYSATWNSRVSSAVAKQQRLATLSRVPELPLEEDLVILNKFIEEEIGKTEDIVRLKKLVLSSLILFNKRRPMEVHDMTIADFQRANNSINDPHDKAIVGKLTATERAIANRMTVVEVRGKSTRQIRKVFVLLSQAIVVAMEKIIASNPNGTYIFSRPMADRPITGTDALNEVKTWCPNLKMPERIHAQRLRHYLATTCQMLKMNDGELKMLADHMGHDLGIHTTRYQLQTSIIERSKIAKLLIRVEQGEEKYGLLPSDGEGETRCDSDGKEESISHLVEVEERENNADCIATISVSDNHDATERQGTKKPRWTQLEKDVFSKLWQDKTTVPSKTILLKIKEALPHRSMAVLRARAHNILKSSTAPNSQL